MRRANVIESLRQGTEPLVQSVSFQEIFGRWGWACGIAWLCSKRLEGVASRAKLPLLPAAAHLP